MSARPSSRRTLLPLLLLAAYALWVAYPMLWVLLSSLKTEPAIASDPFGIPAAPYQWNNYTRAWAEANLAAYFWRSALVTTVSVFLILFLGARAAYALSRLQGRAGAWAGALFLAGLTLPAQLAMVPVFFELRALGLLNTTAGLILVYTANGLPFAVFILTGCFRALPASLHEAAVLDGCGDSAVFWRVMLPLVRPGLVTVAIFQFIGIWKEYFFAFLLASGGARTLPLGLANLAIAAQYRNENGPLFAGIVLVTLPILAIYLFLQRHLVEGITSGAVKG